MSQDFWSLSASPFCLLFCVIIHLPVRLSNVECRHIACRNIMSNHPDDDHILPPEELPCSSLEKQWSCKQFQSPTRPMDQSTKTLGLEKMISKPADMKGVCWSSFWAFGGAPHKTKVNAERPDKSSVWNCQILKTALSALLPSSLP